jgi:hypothetical protein
MTAIWNKMTAIWHKMASKTLREINYIFHKTPIIFET